jgi:hypothetical protein
MDCTPEERDGVKMIQALQRFIGIDESEEHALRGWRRMAEWERERTRDACTVLFGQ